MEKLKLDVDLRSKKRWQLEVSFLVTKLPTSVNTGCCTIVLRQWTT